MGQPAGTKSRPAGPSAPVRPAHPAHPVVRALSAAPPTSATPHRENRCVPRTTHTSRHRAIAQENAPKSISPTATASSSHGPAGVRANDLKVSSSPLA